MWLFTTVGFFSVVKKDSGQLQIRARIASDLDALRTKYLPKLGPTIIKNYADYQYRAYVSKKDFKSAMTRMIDDLTYTNFKHEVEVVQGKRRARLYLEIWGTMYDAESFLTAPPVRVVQVDESTVDPEWEAIFGDVVEDASRQLTEGPADSK